MRQVGFEHARYRHHHHLKVLLWFEEGYSVTKLIWNSFIFHIFLFKFYNIFIIFFFSGRYREFPNQATLLPSHTVALSELTTSNPAGKIHQSETARQFRIILLNSIPLTDQTLRIGMTQVRSETSMGLMRTIRLRRFIGFTVSPNSKEPRLVLGDILEMGFRGIIIWITIDCRRRVLCRRRRETMEVWIMISG